MSKLDLKILMDSDKLQEGYEAGEVVEGEVEIVVNENIETKGVDIFLEWATSGSGNVQKKTLESKKVFEGVLLAGEVSKYPFQFTLPKEGPFHFAGKEIQFYYQIRANVNISWRRNVTEAVQLRVFPSSSPNTIAYNPGSSKIAAQPIADLSDTVHPSYFLLGCFGCFFLFFGLFFGWKRWGVATIAAGFTAVGLTIALFKNYWSQYKIHKPVCEIGKLVCNPGETIPFGCVVTAKRAVLLEGIRVSLKIEERAISGAGSSAQTHSHTLFEQERIFNQGEMLDPGAESRVMDVLQIPSDAPYSLNIDSNNMVAELVIRFELLSFPSYVQRYTLWIIPPGYTLELPTPDQMKAERLKKKKASLEVSANDSV